MITTVSIRESLLRRAGDLSFAACRITTADPVPHDHLVQWLGKGHHGIMRYMARNPEARCDPTSLLPDAQSVICCALPYRFQRGNDYHLVVKEKLKILVEELRAMVPEARTKCCVDTSPLMEKALAERAGLGWIGKNCLLINPHVGSWFVLGEIITDVRLPTDRPIEKGCGDCHACIDACPTAALDGHSLDARQCISYLTIECGNDLEGAYGCEVCQKACPYNNA